MATILIAGGTGLVGTRLSQLLEKKGYLVQHLSRKPSPDALFPTFSWNPSNHELPEDVLAKADVVFNLAGAGIADKAWTAERKNLIIQSRVDASKTFELAFARMKKGPSAYLSAAAMGYYGNRGNEILTEESPAGDNGFLAESCIAWEQAIEAVAQTGIPTTYFRIGLVLSTKGGALPKMTMPLHFFTSGFFGRGKQWYSWIHIDDMCRLMIWAMEKKITGPLNASGPNPVRNKTFASILAEAWGKPALVVPIPEFALKLLLGEMVETVITSTRLSVSKVMDKGFTFQFPDLKEALKDLLARKV